MYVSGSSSFGHGDPSQLLTVKTHCDDSVTATSAAKQTLLPRKFESIASLMAAGVVVILAILTSFVCIKKARLQTAHPPPLISAPVSDGKDGVYVGTMRRYVELDAQGRPVTSGNITHVVDAQGNSMYPASTAAYSGVQMVPVTAATSTSGFKDRPLPPITGH